MWPWEEPVEKALGSPGERGVTKGRCEEFVEETQSAVWLGGPGEASRTRALLRLVLTALESHLGWGGEGQSRAELRGRYTVSTQDGAKGGSGYKRVQLQWTWELEAKQESTLPRSREQEGGEKAEWDGPARCLEEGVCVRGRSWGRAWLEGIPGRLCRARRGPGSGEAGKISTKSLKACHRPICEAGAAESWAL